MVVVITGAASDLGIGRATALAFARSGEQLALCDVDTKGLRETVALCADLGADVAYEVADVSDTESVNGAIRDFASRFGHVDALVANAGIARRRPFVDISDAEWAEVMETNFGGVWRCARAVLPDVIVFLCSEAARYLTGQVLLVDGGVTLGDLSPLQVWPASAGARP